MGGVGVGVSSERVDAIDMKLDNVMSAISSLTSVLQGVAQKGLLTLRSESEKQGKTLASIIKEEIATRTLNFETVNKQIEEVRLQLESLDRPPAHAAVGANRAGEADTVVLCSGRSGAYRIGKGG